MTTPRVRLADDLLRRFAAAVRSRQLYSSGHPIIARNVLALLEAVERLHAVESPIVVGIVEEELIVNDQPSRDESLAGLLKRLRQIAVERVVIERGAGADEIAALLDAVTNLEPGADGDYPPFPPLPHIRVGRVKLDQPVEAGDLDMATFRRMYLDAVSAAETVWESARTEKQPDAAEARAMVDGLAHAVSQNRTALLALATLKKYDDYTFTHMVNVSILTMAQARGLGIDGPLLRELGLAALMHDIGKVRTPLEILNKPEALTEDEFAIMQRHPVDGAEILRSTPDMPTLAPVVAFEHHLRLDGSGYPLGLRRETLNLGTMLCSIADVYDAMRSQRSYQNAFPSDRVLAVLKRNDGLQFDQHLVRRFVQLVGIYPAGSVVRLDTGDTAVVVTVYAPDPGRPHVKIIIDAAGTPLGRPRDIKLWECPAEGDGPRSIAAPVDPADVGVDALSLLQA
jgi:putative nucleotidyltransferase with HDIG domain